ncbi:hypothetical protein [Hydrogenophaga sp.]|uniref:hypothetical protein n=1 Tax=Hydrogenophaga sp. TaxID=1904254 RepID=UPI003AF47F20
MHLYRHSLRHATWMILTVWLFALGAGVANACLLNQSNSGSHSSFAAMPQDVPVAQTHHGEKSDPDDAGCLKFCDEASLAITKVDQPITDGSPVSVGVLYRASGPTIASATAVQVRVHATRPAHLALPIAARPHRLTL